MNNKNDNFKNEIIVKSILKKFNISSYEYEDLYYEGILVSLKAQKDYDPSFNTKISTYIYMRVKCHYLSLYRSTKALKRDINNNLNLDFYEIEESALFYDQSLCSFPTQEKDFEERELKQDLYSLLKKVLNNEEFEIICLFLQGYTSCEIAKKLNINKRQVSNKIYYIKSKLRKKSYIFENFKKIL